MAQIVYSGYMNYGMFWIRKVLGMAPCHPSVGDLKLLRVPNLR